MPTNATNRREQLRRQQEAAAKQRRTTRIVGVIAGVLALVLIGVFAAVLVTSQQNKPDATPAMAQIVPPNANADKNGLVVGKGAEGTPTVTLYLDYQCPLCRQFEHTYGEMLQSEAAAGTWTLVNKTMTFMDSNLKNTASTRSAIAASCSATVGHYAEYGLEIYNNQETQEVRGSVGYSDELLRVTIPTKLGFTPEQLTQFQACYDGRATQDFVAAVDKGAYTDGATGTPTVMVNGKVVYSGFDPRVSVEALKAKLLASA